jgi:hypothetical protein
MRDRFAKSRQLCRSKGMRKTDMSKYLSKARKPKNLNAIKHGAFSEMVLFPGEDQEEFDALHQALIEEWNPEGPTQHDKVFNIAQNMWRKRRSANYRLEMAKWGERLLRADDREIDHLITFLEDVEAGKPISELRLPRIWVEFYEKECPRKKFESDAKWLKALENEVGVLWGLCVEARGKGTKKYVEKWFCDEKVILEHLAIEERLDAKIDKDITALGRMKTMQQMGLGRRQVVIDQTATPVDAPDAPVKLPGQQLGSRSDQVEVPAGEVESPPLVPELAGVDGGQPDAPAEAPAEQVDVGQPEAQPEAEAAENPTQPTSAEVVDKKDAA